MPCKCRRARLAQTIPHTETSLTLSFSKSAEASLSEFDVRDTTDLPPLPSDHLLCQQPVSEDLGSSVSTELSRKRGRDVDEVLHSHSVSPQAPYYKTKSASSRGNKISGMPGRRPRWILSFQDLKTPEHQDGGVGRERGHRIS